MIQLKDIIEQGTKAYVVDVEIAATSNCIYSLAILNKKKEELSFQFPILETPNLEVIKKSIPSESPICLVINGKGILYKFLNIQENTSDTSIVKQLLPDANPDDFYIQRLEMESSENKRNNIVSLVRKETIDPIVETFSNMGFVTSVSIGPFIFNNILSFFPSIQQVNYKNLTIQIQSNEISGYEHQENRQTDILKLNDQEVNSTFLPSLSLGIAFLTNADHSFSDIHTIYSQQKEYQYKQKSVKILKYALLIFFALLLISYLLFDTYYSKAERLQSEMAQKEQISSELEELRKSYNSKNKFLKESGLLGQTKLSYHLDKIAETIPSSIVLDEMIANPIQKKIGLKDATNFEKNIILINGFSKDSYIFNQWIKDLKSIPSFADVSIIRYEYKEKEGKAYFSVKINL